MQERFEVVSWKLFYTRQARKDAKKLSVAGLRHKAENLLNIISNNSFTKHPPLAAIHQSVLVSGFRPGLRKQLLPL